MSSTKVLVAAVVASCLWALKLNVALAAPIVVNPSFEVDDWSVGTVGDLAFSGGGVTGWTIVSPSGPDVHPEGRHNGFSAGPTPYGAQWVILGPYGTGGNYIEQTIPGFTPGNPYLLTFSISSENVDGGALVEVSFPSGSPTPPGVFVAPASSAFQGWDNWMTFAKPFVATSPSVTVRFLDLGSTTFNDIGLDNISVIPEPSSLTIVGLAGLGLACQAWRMRKRKA